MSLRLKEDPRDWMKFTAATAVASGALTVLLWKRQTLSGSALTSVLAVLSVTLLICLIRPTWFRSFYRIGLTLGFHVGQLVGKILLAIVFWFVLTPMGLLLRLLGNDLLGLKKNPSKATYWHPARASEPPDRQF